MKPQESTRAETPDLPSIRLRVLEHIIWAWGVMGGLIVFVVSLDDAMNGRYRAAIFYAVSYVFVLVCLAPRYLPYRWRCSVALAMMYAVGTHEVLFYGIESTGTVFYYALVVFTAILLGARAAAGVTLFAIGSLCGISYYYEVSRAAGDAWPSFLTHVHRDCLPDLACLIFLSTISITFLAQLLRSLEESLDSSRHYLAEMARDRNHLIRTIEQRDQAERQLRQAQKMEAVGQLAGGIAHNFNNLLQVISAHADLLLKSLPPDSEEQMQAGEVRRASERAAMLTRQLLAYSRQQVMAPEYLDLNALAGDFLRLLVRVIPESVRIKFEPGPEVGTVHADPGQIEQVLMNLCLNARDAMPSGGDLTIATECVELKAAELGEYRDLAPGRYVVLRVSDTGRGISEADRERIFEPFFTTKEFGQGTGLGLAMADGIVRQHHGAIGIASGEGAGSTFRVYLPQVDHAPRPRTVEPLRSSGIGRETILIAEDDDAVRELIVNVVRGAGYTVFAAANGREAVSLFEAHREAIDLLLFDVVMPEMGGREACAAIRAMDPEMRVLYMSGYAPDGLDERLDLRGGTGFIQKPYRTQQLLERMREMLDA
ncbi:MAG: response regulator [Candidatus Hydrogenedentes bacterium]|nr:response regulator [Candidatus Hydrogenedentota bacterium]